MISHESTRVRLERLFCRAATFAAILLAAGNPGAADTPTYSDEQQQQIDQAKERLSDLKDLTAELADALETVDDDAANALKDASGYFGYAADNLSNGMDALDTINDIIQLERAAQCLNEAKLCVGTDASCNKAFAFGASELFKQIKTLTGKAKWTSAAGIMIRGYGIVAGIAGQLFSDFSLLVGECRLNKAFCQEACASDPEFNDWMCDAVNDDVPFPAACEFYKDEFAPDEQDSGATPADLTAEADEITSDDLENPAFLADLAKSELDSGPKLNVSLRLMSAEEIASHKQRIDEAYAAVTAAKAAYDELALTSWLTSGGRDVILQRKTALADAVCGAQRALQRIETSSGTRDMYRVDKALLQDIAECPQYDTYVRFVPYWEK